MLTKRRPRAGQSTALAPAIARRRIHPRRSLILAVALALAAALGLGGGASAALAATGSVYVDGNSNVGAGHDFFGGTMPTGFDNVGIGYSVMPNLTFGSSNVASGFEALKANTNGGGNVAIGSDALRANTTGVTNVAVGAETLVNSTLGVRNVATGMDALWSNTNGRKNVASGFQALFKNRGGEDNIAIGAFAGSKLTTGDDNIDIANPGVAGESGMIRIGTAGAQTAAFLQGVSGTTIPGPTQAVRVNAAGQLGTATAASDKAANSGPKPLSAAAGRRLLATVKRLQQQNRRQGKEIRALRAQRG